MGAGTPSFIGFAPGAAAPSEQHFATNGGAAAAGMPIATNANGLIDPSFGAIGATGPAGAAGATGPTGSNGAAGATGSAGPAGAVGAQGPTGAIGAAGAQGQTGSTGATGTAGTQGTVGATGPAGATGAQGATGPAGSASTTVVASEAIAANAMCNVYNNGGTLNVQNADGSVQTRPCNCYAPAAIAQGATGTVTFISGLISGLSGLTPGDAFLSVSARGAVQSSGATGAAAGQTYQRLGEILSASTMVWVRETPIFRN